MWSTVEFIDVNIGHAGTMLDKIYKSLVTVLSALQSDVAHARATRGDVDPDVDNAARSHELSIFKEMLDAITKLAQDKHTTRHHLLSPSLSTCTTRGSKPATSRLGRYPDAHHALSPYTDHPTMVGSHAHIV
jgi:hypothetical protein